LKPGRLKNLDLDRKSVLVHTNPTADGKAELKTLVNTQKTGEHYGPSYPSTDIAVPAKNFPK
jgi:hypothetical protein